MNEFNILYSKDGFTFVKNKKNNYSLSFNMENNCIILSKIIDFSLIELIYKLNSDIYENITLTKIDDNRAIMCAIMKHLFEEVGLPQKFSYVHMIKKVEPSKITFESTSIYSDIPSNVPETAQQMPIKNMICECNVITPNRMGFCCNVIFDDNMFVPQFAEKMIGLILFKIFNRVKYSIENIKM